MLDILFGEDGDLLIENGDLVVGDATEQHIYDLLVSYKGWWKFEPLVGLGIHTFLEDDKTVQELERVIVAELENNGMRVKEIGLSAGGNINVVARYEAP